MTAKLLQAAGFKVGRPTKIASHGWQASYSSFHLLPEAYLLNQATRETNVMLVDWSIIASDWKYISTAMKVPDVGDALGKVSHMLFAPHWFDSSGQEESSSIYFASI